MGKTFLSIFLMVLLLANATVFAVLQLSTSKQPSETDALPPLLVDSLLAIAPDTLPPKPPPPVPVGMRLLNTETLKAGAGVKSVIFDNNQSFLYAFNLEGMSIMEFEQSSRLRTRTLYFKKTPARGFDYQRDRWINSWEEKPVEGCLSHNGKYLWASLHNAGGIVAWNLEGADSLLTGNYKQAVAVHYDGRREQTRLKFIKTATTPKVILPGTGGKYLYVSNWHDNSLSVVDIEGSSPADWYLMKNLPTGSVPRGICSIPGTGKLVVANMGGGSVSVINTYSMEQEHKRVVGTTPRHLIASGDYLYASLSQPEKIVKMDLQTLEPLLEARTADDPRTIAFSRDSTLIFATCYNGQKLQVFTADSLKLLGTWNAAGKPVGVDIWQKGKQLEAWVCNYTIGTIKIFSFEILYAEEKKPRAVASMEPPAANTTLP